MKKLEMVKGGIGVLVTMGVSTLVTGALILITPNKLGAIKKIAVGVAWLAISCMAVEAVTTYVEKQIDQLVEQFKDIFKKKPVEVTIEVEGV